MIQKRLVTHVQNLEKCSKYLIKFLESQPMMMTRRTLVYHKFRRGRVARLNSGKSRKPRHTQKLTHMMTRLF